MDEEQCLHEETPQSSQGRADLYTHKAYFIIEHLYYLNVLLNVICWATFILTVWTWLCVYLVLSDMRVRELLTTLYPCHASRVAGQQKWQPLHPIFWLNRGMGVRIGSWSWDQVQTNQGPNKGFYLLACLLRQRMSWRNIPCFSFGLNF